MNTPRTDALLNDAFTMLRPTPNCEAERYQASRFIDLARTLERELAEAREITALANSQSGKWAAESAALRAALEECLTAYDSLGYSRPKEFAKKRFEAINLIARAALAGGK